MGKILYLCGEIINIDMATLNYIIKSAKKTTFATLWIRLRSGREYDIFVQSGYSIPPELWN
ncbi:MAG: hypothetical protein SNJ29_12850, partial [Rikenellaceae bacterium]